MQPPAHLESQLEEGGQANRARVKRHTYKKRHPFVVGKVYANWCGHCQSLKPEWSKMKGLLKKRKHGIKYVEIEETQKDQKFAEVKQKYGVEIQANGYPTLFKIEGGKLSYYDGQRTAEQMSDWYSNSSSQKLDQNGFFRGPYFGGFKSLHDMRRTHMKKARGKTRTAKRSRGIFRGLFKKIF